MSPLRPRLSLHISVLVGLAMLGCQGQIGDAPTDPVLGPGPEGVIVDVTQCESGYEPLLDHRGLKRLTRLQYDNSLRSLLGDDTQPSRGVPEDEDNGGYPSNGIAPLDSTQFDAYFAVAEDVAARAVAGHADEWMPCDREETNCVSSFLEDLVARAFRRPPTADEVEEFVALYEAVRDGAEASGDDGVETAITALLLAPEFMYHVELGEAAADGRVALTQHELASAVSYFLWNDVPDDVLRRAADAGELSSSRALEAQVRRMVHDERAEGSVRDFHRRWVQIKEPDEIERDLDVFPDWTPELASDIDEETREHFAFVFNQEGASLADLLTASYTVGSERLADHYGAAPPAADGRIELDPSERAGLLTLGGFLVSQSRPDQVDWIHRGLVVRRFLLCGDVPPAPASADLTQTQNDSRRLDNPECRGCHVLMDPIGMGFDQYDATGRFLADVNTANGTIRGGDAIGVPEEFDGVVELAHSLAESDHVHACYSEQWFRYAMGRTDSAGDLCQLHSLSQTFIESGGDIRELLVQITLMEAFRERFEGEEQ